MKLVIVESPYAGAIVTHTDYARACLADCLRRNEAPFASHLLYTQPGVLDDTIPEERTLGIAAGYAWWKKADLWAFYTDCGWSPGMKAAKAFLDAEGFDYEIRSIEEPAQCPR